MITHNSGEPLIKKPDEQFELKGKDAEEVGKLSDDGFVVLEGAIARKEVVPSGIDSVIPIRTRLLSEGVLVDEGDCLRFVKDYTFKSPSGAATAVMGRTANGWTMWKHSDGRTLSEVKRIARPTGEMMLSCCINSFRQIKIGKICTLLAAFAAAFVCNRFM